MKTLNSLNELPNIQDSMRDVVLSVIKTVQQSKEGNTEPHHVTRLELINKLKEYTRITLSALEDEKRVISHDTVHGKAYTINSNSI